MNFPKYFPMLALLSIIKINMLFFACMPDGKRHLNFLLENMDEAMKNTPNELDEYLRQGGRRRSANVPRRGVSPSGCGKLQEFDKELI